MGEAKKRGAYEQRVAQAVAEGRVKEQPTEEEKKGKLLGSLSYWDGIRQQNIWVLQNAVRRMHTLS